MDDARVGRSLRAVRVRRGWRQEDVALRAGVSQNAVSRAERGLLDGMTLGGIRAIGEAIGVLMDLQPRWRGGELDRLLGARHSALHEAVAARFAALSGWTTVPEVTFSEFGERGAIDVLAWHAPTRTLLVIELKTELVDVQEMLGTLDRKRRLARRVAGARGWDPAAIGVWVILSEHRTNRRRVDEHRTVLRSALPADGRTMNAWLLAPRGPVAGLSFWPRSDEVPGNRSLAPVRRVRVSGKVP
ncbi:MAG TPA: helix-turn-helix transcriptional regulator [Propionicimonas sp.]|jgi:transcriptional regulator with XRE-family HTH domain